MELWTLAVIINLFLFYSVFDIYFKSPIVPVERRHRLDKDVVQAPFKRVVFFVGDGLRLDTFTDNPHRRPYLSKVMERKDSVWGVSDTRVPTETRPGHIALFAGFYEDPSAIFTGWKENTVEFDSIFNQSSFSVGLGSPDTVTMFATGAAKSKMLAASYPRDWQDFSHSSFTRLDSWVFDYLSNLVQKQTLPQGNEVVIFLNLLGIDTTGHAVKPWSDEYVNAMEYVDELIRKTETMIDHYYGDKETLYIFTADHGMTDWGSHGDGSLHETETPFVVWGKGIHKEGADPLRVKQADFTALMAGILGVGFPSNSVGRFPGVFWEDQRFAYEALKANFYQIFDLMDTKKLLVKSNRNLPIVNFGKEALISAKMQTVLTIASKGEYSVAIQEVNEAIDIALEGVVYYERYDEVLLIILTVCTSISWIFVVAYVIINMNAVHGVKRIFTKKSISISFLVSLFVTKVIIGWSIWRVPYGFFPVFLVLLLMKLVGTGRNSNSQQANCAPGTAKNSWINSLFLLLVFCALGVEILVNSFDKRGALSFGLVLNAIWCVRAKKVSSWQKTIFFIAVALLAIFPMMPVIGKERNALFMTLGPLVSTFLVSILFYIQRKKSSRDGHLIVSGQILLLLLVSVLCHFPSLLITRLVAWFSLLTSFFLPVFTSAETLIYRLISMFLAIASPFSLISFSYEALFFPCLFLVLIILLKIEMSEENLEDSWEDFLTLSTESTDRRKIWERVDLHQAVRRAWLHLFFVTLSFFGTGNIASVNSFDPSSTRCFVSVFNPWIMMVVLIEKMIGPFLLVSCFFRRLLWSKIQVERSFLIVLLLCQGMALHTFFQVRNQGSWLEIGLSISHHVIVNATTLFLSILHFIADFIMSYEPWSSKSTRFRFSIPIFANNADTKRVKTF